MKKILLSSLLAVMAVTSANAKIASTNYVDEVAQTKADAAQAAAKTYTDDEIAALDATTTGDGAVVTSVTQTDGKVTVTKGNIDYSSLTGIPTVDTEMSDTSTNAVQNKVIKSYVDGVIAGVEDEMGDGYQKLDQKLKATDDESKITTENRDLLYPSYAKTEAMVGTLKAYTDQQFGALDATTTGDGAVVTSVTQIDGKVTVTKGNIDYSSLTGIPTVDTAMNADSTNAVQNKVIKSYVDTEVGKKQDTLTTGQLAAVDSGITAAKVTTYDGYEEGKQDTLTTEQLAAVNSGITAAKVATYDGYATGKQDTLSAEQLAAVNSGITDGKVAAITQNTNDIAAITSATIAEDGNEDGQYVLTKKVVDGVTTYSWELIDRALANQ